MIKTIPTEYAPAKRGPGALRKPTTPILFAFAIIGNASQNDIYKAAIEAMQHAEYEPPAQNGAVHAAVHYTLSGPNAGQRALKAYACLGPALQNALGNDVQLTVSWAGTHLAMIGASVEVTEVK